MKKFFEKSKSDKVNTQSKYMEKSVKISSNEIVENLSEGNGIFKSVDDAINEASYAQSKYIEISIERRKTIIEKLRTEL